MALTKAHNRMIQNSPANIIDYGADSTGANDSATAIQAALNSGRKTIYIPEGTYLVNATLSVPKDVSIIGEGSNVSVLDFSNVPDGSITDAAHIKTAEATFTALPALGSNVTKNDRTLTFSSAPSLSVGDIIHIYNPTDGSWLNSRTYYRAGEYARVATVSGTSITIEGSFTADYTAASVDVYRVDNMTTCAMKGFGVVAKPSSTVAINGIKLNTALDSSFEDIRVSNATYTGFSLSRCFNIQVTNCVATDDFLDSFGGEYGLGIANCHIVNVVGGSFASRRHGLTVGGGNGVGKTTNRYISIDSCHIATTGGSQAADCHGNTEYISFNNCVFDGGITPGGDYIIVDGCNIRGDMVNGPVACYVSELHGCNITISNNIIQNNENAPVRGNMIDIGGNNDTISSDTVFGGSILISNNTFESNPTSAIDDYIKITNRGYTGTDHINVSVNGNIFGSNKSYDYASILYPAQFAVDLRLYSGNPFGVAEITNNSGVGGLIMQGNPSQYCYEQAVIKNNNMRSGYQAVISKARDIAEMSGNTFNDYKYYSAVGSISGYNTDTCVLSNNTFKNCGWDVTSSSSTNATTRVAYADNAMVQGNFVTGNPLRLRLTATASGWTIGETVTGGTSGATATVYNTRDADLMIKESKSGTFVSGETVTGSTSGTTATVAAAVTLATRTYSFTYLDIGSLYRGNQVDVAGEPSYTSSISSDNTL